MVIKDYNFNNFEFFENTKWKYGLQVKPTVLDSFIYLNSIDLFFLLKSYVDHEASVIRNIHIILNIEEETKPGLNFYKVLYPIKLYELKNFNNINQFNDWWEIVVLKLGHYEQENKKLNFLFTLNAFNIMDKFNVFESDIYLLRPIYPWKKKIVNYHSNYLNENKLLKDIIRRKKLK